MEASKLPRGDKKNIEVKLPQTASISNGGIGSFEEVDTGGRTKNPNMKIKIAQPHAPHLNTGNKLIIRRCDDCFLHPSGHRLRSWDVDGCISFCWNYDKLSFLYNCTVFSILPNTVSTTWCAQQIERSVNYYSGIAVTRGKKNTWVQFLVQFCICSSEVR